LCLCVLVQSWPAHGEDEERANGVGSRMITHNCPKLLFAHRRRAMQPQVESSVSSWNRVLVVYSRSSQSNALPSPVWRGPGVRLETCKTIRRNPFVFFCMTSPRQNGFVGLAALSQKERVSCHQYALLIWDKCEKATSFYTDKVTQR
jgi:hypothetical protein